MKARYILQLSLPAFCLLAVARKEVSARAPSFAEPPPRTAPAAKSAGKPGAGAQAAPSTSGAAPAPQTHFAAEVLVLHATNEKKGIDPRIAAMPELRKPPFSSYDSYALLERNQFSLDPRHPKTLTLPNGRVLETRLLEILATDSVRLSASINQPGGKEFLPLLEVKAKLGQAFIVAGQRYKRGILVLVIRVSH
ncbi:MAG TPA: hypothetical protein VFQ61_11575 [Polyangiaceae bacterium]|nr:hypothetical protein [Polyangiaceae bacterium]